MPATAHNSIASEFDVFRHMFDVIANEVRGYSANASRLSIRLIRRFERLNVIAIVQVKSKSHAVKHAARFNLQE